MCPHSRDTAASLSRVFHTTRQNKAVTCYAAHGRGFCHVPHFSVFLHFTCKVTAWTGAHGLGVCPKHCRMSMFTVLSSFYRVSNPTKWHLVQNHVARFTGLRHMSPLSCVYTRQRTFVPFAVCMHTVKVQFLSIFCLFSFDPCISK
jgi:hypothetical protein